MFKKKEKSHRLRSSSSKLGLTISSPMSTIKNNSEIIYMANEAIAPSTMSTYSSFTSKTRSMSIGADNGYISPISPTSPASGSRSPFIHTKPLTPPEDNNEPTFVPFKGRPSPEKISVRNLKRTSDESITRRRPSFQPSIASSKLDDELKLITSIDLSSSSSTVQMIATTGRLPPWLQRCTNLKHLVAKNLGITIIDEWVSSCLTNLEVIRLNNNQIATWPHHLSRLVQFGNLQVIDLEGNPCLTTMFKKAPTFRSLYIEAALSGHMDTSDNIDILLKRTKSTNSSGKSSHTAKQSSIFNMKGHKAFGDEMPSDDEEDDDDDMLTSLEPKARPIRSLRKHSSATGLFSSFDNKNILVLNKSMGKSQSTPVSMYPSPNLNEESPVMQDYNEQNSGDHYNQVDVAKSRVILCLLHDIYELATRTPLQVEGIPHLQEKKVSTEQFRSSISSGSSSLMSANSSRFNSVMSTPTTEASFPIPQTQHRLNNLDVLEHYLEDFNKLSINKVDLPLLTQQLSDFVEEEKKFADKMNEFAEVYFQTKSKEARKAQVIFKQLPEIIHLHKDIILRTLIGGLERVKIGNDGQLDYFTKSLLPIMSSIELVYVAYAKVVESSKRQARFWLKLFKQTYATTSMYYGATYGGYVATQHPECEIGEWLRTCAKDKKHSLASVVDYLQLPLSRLESYRSFFRVTSGLFPNLEPIYNRLETINHEVQKTLPLEIRASRYVDLKKLFKFPSTSYGNYLCDTNVIIQCKISLNDVNISKGKTGDVMYQPSEGVSKNVPKHAEFEYSDITNPPKGNSFRMVIMDEAVLLVNESKRNVSRVILKKDIYASFPWKFSDDVVGPVTSRDSNSTTKTATTVLTNQRSSLEKCLRLAIHDTSEVWYLSVKTFTGDISGGSLNEARSELMKSINSQGN